MKAGRNGKKQLEESKDGGVSGMVGKKTLGKGTELVIRKTLKELKKSMEKALPRSGRSE